MLIDGLDLVEGSGVLNLTVPIGTAFPSTPDYGELFYRTDEDKLYIYSTTGSTWVAIAKGSSDTSKWTIFAGTQIYQLDNVAIGIDDNQGYKLRIVGTVKIDGEMSMGTNQIVSNATPLLATHLVNKSYVDGFVSGVVWDSPIRHVNLVNDSLTTPPVSPEWSDVYIVATGGTGAWTGLDGHIVQYNGTTWIDQGALATGDRFGIMIEGTSTPAGSFTGLKNYIVEWDGAAWINTAPSDKRAVFVSYAGSLHAWHQYVYEASATAWIEFGGPNQLVAGANLQFTGNTLDVTQGAGSGLDADTLDGQQLTDLDARYVLLTGGVMSGDLTTTGKVTAIDFVMPAIDQIFTEVNVIDSVIYDTTQDSDGGNWRFNKGASWYSESVPTGNYIGRYANLAAAVASGGQAGDWYMRSGTTPPTKFFSIDAGLATATEIFRAGRQEFPKYALIVIESSKLVIYDLTTSEPTMWKAFYVVGGASYMRSSGTTTTVFAKEGILATGHNSAEGISVANFADDSWYLYDTGGKYQAAGVNNNLVDANVAGSSWIKMANTPLINDTVNDVTMIVLPDAPVNTTTGLKIPTIGIATDGGINIISNDNVWSSAQTNYFKHIEFDNDGRVIAVYGNAGSGYTVYYSLDAPAANFSLSFYDYLGLPPVNLYYDLAVGDNNIISGTNTSGNYPEYALGILRENKDDLTKGMVAYLNTNFNTGWMVGDTRVCLLSDSTVETVVSAELVTNGTFDTDLTGWTLTGDITPTWDTSGAVNLQSNTNDGAVAQDITTVIGKTYTITFDVTYNNGAGFAGLSVDNVLVLDNAAAIQTYSYTFVATATTHNIQVAWRGGAGLIGYIDNITTRIAEIDRSSKYKGSQVFGTITKSLIDANGELVAYSGFNNSNYIKQQYTPDLDFGTSDFWFGVWVKEDAVTLTVPERIFTRGYFTGTVWSGPLFELYFVSSGALEFYMSDDGAVSSDVLPTPLSYNDGVWHFVECYVTNGTQYIVVDGVVVNSQPLTNATGTMDNTDATLILGLGNDGSNGLENGSIALFRASATIPTDAQRKHIYETERRMIANKCLLDGTANSVQTVDYNEKRKTFSAGTSWGRSDFVNLTRVSSRMTTDGTMTSISADGDIVLDGGSSGSHVYVPEIDLRAESFGRLFEEVSDDEWISATLLNGWQNYGGDYPDAAFKKTKDGRVQLRGLIRFGTATVDTTLFYLPFGYRPNKKQHFPVVSNAAFGYAQVNFDGSVNIESGDNTWFDLGSISFYID